VEDDVIFLVQDDTDDEARILHEMRKNHIANRVLIARDGLHALRYIFGGREAGGPPEHEVPRVVLLDLHVSKFGGMELLRRLRGDRRTGDVPVIVLGEPENEEERAEAESLGVHSFIHRPFRFWEFEEAMLQLGLDLRLIGDPLAHTAEVGAWAPRFWVRFRF
jgi:two-component system response regulator